jgi:hypothetical protein
MIAGNAHALLVSGHSPVLDDNTELEIVER